MGAKIWREIGFVIEISPLIGRVHVFIFLDNLLKSPRQRGGDGRVHARSARRSTDTLRHSFFTVFQATVFAMEWCVSRKPRRLPRPFVPEIFLSWVSTQQRKVSRSPWTRHPPAPPSMDARHAHPAGIAPDIEADIHPRPSHPRTPATTRATWKTTSSASPSEDVSNT